MPRPPDSAPTAGAMNAGFKQRFNLGDLGENASTEDCTTGAGNELTTFVEIVSAEGMDKSVGTLSTARITHTTPARVYAKTISRDWESAVPEECTGSPDIAAQLLDQMDVGVIVFVMGSGWQAFIAERVMNEEGKYGGRTHGGNLI